MKAAKKVIILDNIKSDLISQAIFILSDSDADEFSAVSEAERIVWDYLGGIPLSRFSRRRFLKRPIALTVLISLLACTLLFCVVKIF